MSKRKQRRYTSERAILADIYAAQRKKNALLKESEEHEALAKALIVKSATVTLGEDDVEELKWQKGLAAKARRAADRQDGIVTKLRLTQDAFCTGTMPFLSDDSVVTQKP